MFRKFSIYKNFYVQKILDKREKLSLKFLIPFPFLRYF